MTLFNIPNSWKPIVGRAAIILSVCALLNNALQQTADAQSHCDPLKVMTAETCTKCHVNEVQVWRQTPHFRTFEQLSRNPNAKEICKNLGLRSPKRSDVCIKCHYTLENDGGRTRPVSGISCESCHGASRDWINTHHDYGGPTASKESESEAHRNQRLHDASIAGMRNTQNLYAIASSCYSCHTVPDEELVNVGGHNTGSVDFELVAWSQGTIRHNFLRTGNTSNAISGQNRLRMMYVTGLIVDLEYSTRATAVATEKSNYGVAVADRAARTAVKLFDLQQQLNDPNVQSVLESFATADLKINNADQLNAIADAIAAAGQQFAEVTDGERLAAVDPLLPSAVEYK